ncbi:MAG: hypothetical protein ABI151_08340, partial [Chitinophagaceae bacterium]
MRSLYIVSLLILLSNISSGQKNREAGIAIMNTGTAYPFGQFGKLLTQWQHPGFEIHYSFNWDTKSKHDWYQEYQLGYFYHRFVQHAFQLYSDIGYRYKYKRATAQAAIGVGYLHAIPATAVLKLAPDGEYKNAKGIGKAQAMAVAKFTFGYLVNSSGKRPCKVFATYQQLLQTPFVKEYVPILPYNSLL